MIQRLYVHNFKCLENFELIIKGMSSVLLIGKNGSGKSTISIALEILQTIGRGVNRMGELEKMKLISPKDFARGRSDVPIRFEIEVLLNEKLYKYVLALELPERFKELRVFEEQLLVSGSPIYSRQGAQVTLYTSSQNREAQFLFEGIGEALAEDCANNTNELWGHDLLEHNRSELDRMILSVKPFLFVAI